MGIFYKSAHIVAATSERSDGPMGNTTNEGPSGEYEQNRLRFLARYDIRPDQVFMAVLAHGVNGATVFAVPPGGSVPNTDGLISMRPALAITTADCFPVFFADASDPNVGVVGLAHAGWRSILGGIIGAMIEKLEARGANREDGLFAAIGPGIRSCCFTVRDDENGISRYLDRGYGHFAVKAGKDPSGNEFFRVDLAGIIYRQLSELGLPPSRIRDSQECTFCDSRFISWRRDHLPAHNMLSVIQLRRQEPYEKFIL